MKIFNKIREVYKDENITIKEKAISLFLLNILLTVGFLLLAVNRFFFNKDYLMSGIELFISLTVFLFAYMIIKKHYVLISHLSLVLFFLSALSLSIVREINGALDIYVYSTYIIPVIITAPLLSYKHFQILYTIISSNILLSLLFFFKISPYLTSNSLKGGTSEFVVSFLMTLFSSFFAYQLFDVQNRSLKEIQKQKNNSDNQLLTLNQLFDSSNDSFNIGRQLIDNAQKYISISNNIYGKSKQISGHIEELLKDANNTRSINDEINKSNNTVKDNISNQTEAINNTLNSTGSIINEIKKLLDIGNSKIEEIDRIINSIQKGIDQINNTVGSISKIEQSSEAILSTIKVIEDITVKTNLLAMNASIEAAHAGESGAGFSVVAEEIRSLAEGTGQNSKMIKEKLNAINFEIKSAVEAGSGIQKFFDENISMISSFKEALYHLIDQIKLVSEENSKINEFTESLNNINTNVNSSLMKMNNDLSTGINSNDNIINLINKLYISVNDLNDSVNMFSQETGKLSDLGKKNQETNEKFNEIILNIKSDVKYKNKF
ncbi:MAG: hypothetical protein JXB50_08700 [Spirochaetes bacterium]|nr:hypothetical protein [Spirochaetota bacterium]